MPFLNSQGVSRLWQYITAALNTKVDKADGKGLSTNDYTNNEKNKLSGVEEGATRTEIADSLEETTKGKALDAKKGKELNDKINGVDGRIATQAAATLAEAKEYTDEKVAAVPIPDVGSRINAHDTNNAAHQDIRDSIPTTADDVGAVPTERKVNGKALSDDITLSASDVGADASGAAEAVQNNLDSHSSDATVHISADERIAWNAKATTAYVDEKVAGIVNSAPEALDTLNELAAALDNDPNFATTVSNQIGTKVPNTRTINGKSLAGDITLSASDLGAMEASIYDPQGIATDIFSYVNEHAANIPITSTPDNDVNIWIDPNEDDQNDIFYTAGEVNDLLANKASATHASQHASGGSDPITPASIGAYSKSETDTLLANKRNWKGGIVTGVSILDWAAAQSIPTDCVCDSNTSDMPYEGYWMIDLDIYPEGGWKRLTATNILSGDIWHRNCNCGDWDAGWSCQNPPMELGKEYRTTERWGGSPVYAQFFDCSPLPNATTKVFPVEGNYADNVFAVVDYGGMSPYYGQSLQNKSFASLEITASKIYIMTETDLSAGNAYVWVKYVKRSS